MKYPCETNYCGCNMTKISNCEDCYYKSTHQDMGASWDVCTLHKDLSSATIACETSDNCKSKITYKEVNQAIEKQIPKKVSLYKNKENFEWENYPCPSCGEMLGLKVNKRYVKFCPNCGQRLNWSEEK